MESKFPRLDTIMGRTDDMMKIKGVNVFPSQIEEILKEFSEVSSEYQIRISHLDGKDTMRIYVRDKWNSRLPGSEQTNCFRS